MMHDILNGFSSALSVTARVLILVAALMAPIMALYSVPEFNASTIESLEKPSSGAGLVIMFGLQRS